MVSSYPTSTNIPRVDGLSTDPREMGRHTTYQNILNKNNPYIPGMLSFKHKESFLFDFFEPLSGLCPLFDL